MNMNIRFFKFLSSLRLHSIASAAVLSIAPLAGAQDVPSNMQAPSALHAAGPIASVDQAEQALIEVGQERSRIRATFAEEERVCYTKFFTTSCLDKAKERQRLALAKIRPVEIEAQAFKRRADIAARDKALEENRAKEQAQAPERAQTEKENESELAKKEAKAAEKKAAEKTSESGKSGATDRVAQHRAKLQKEQAEEDANAKKRAEKIAAYEKKLRASQARQREIAEKKAKRESERAAKAATSKP